MRIHNNCYSMNVLHKNVVAWIVNMWSKGKPYHQSLGIFILQNVSSFMGNIFADIIIGLVFAYAVTIVTSSFGVLSHTALQG